MGVFPSFYEPWGYTPLETSALGVASVTSDLAGFGKFLLQHKEFKNKGVFILNRMGKQDNEVVGQLADLLYRFCHFSKKERVYNKLEARNLAGLADWDLLINNYFRAFNLAVEKVLGS